MRCPLFQFPVPHERQQKIDEIETLDNAAGFSTDHLNWYANRYRSFSAKANTYRSFSGETKSCSSPLDGCHSTSGEHLDQAPHESMAAWCAARYQSYRREDNPYQPQGGDRRPCQGAKARIEMAIR
jgi:hypothetical protein